MPYFGILQSRRQTLVYSSNPMFFHFFTPDYISEYLKEVCI